MPTCPSCSQNVHDTFAHCPHCGTSLGGVAAEASVATADIPIQDIEIPDELREALAPEIQILHPLARGGMGVVFLGREPALKRSVVVKMLSPELAKDRTARARFAREAEAAAGVTHPNVIEVYRVGELPSTGTSFMVMSHIDGDTLDEEFALGDMVPEAKVKHIVGTVASALARAHERGLVHRDIKPSNIMIERLSNRPIVLDFGISAVLSPAGDAPATKLTVEGTAIGTPQYMSPEQAAGDVPEEKSDIYSLSAVAYRLLTGRPPFEADTALAVMAAHLKDKPSPVRSVRPDLDPQFAELIDAGLAKDPDERPDAEQLARALQATTHPVVEWPPPGLERLQGRGARLLRWAQSAVIGLIICYVFLAVYSGTTPSPEGTTAGQAITLFLTAGGFIACLLFTMAVMAEGGSLNAIAWWGRRSGYPLVVAYDAALDHTPDTELLLNGLGSYATLPADARHRILVLRRVSAVALILGTLGSMVAALLWNLGWIGSQTEVLISWPQVLVITAPGIAGVLLRHVIGLPERKMRRRYAPAEDRWRLKQPPLVAPELVGGWLGAARLATPKPISRATAILGDNLTEIVWIPAIGLGLLATLGVVMMTSAGVYQPVDRSEAHRLFESLGDSTRLPWSTLRSAMDDAARLGNPLPGPDHAAGAELLLIASPRPPEPWYKVDATAALDVDPFAESTVDSVTLWRAWSRLPSVLSDSLRTEITRHANTRGLSIWRRFARSPSYRPGWHTRLRDTEDREGVPGLVRLGVLVRYARSNSGAALLAASDRQFAAAEERAREILSVARHLVNDPYPQAHRMGIAIARIGTRTLTHVARLSGNAELDAEAAGHDRLLRRRTEDLKAVNRRSVAVAAIDPHATESLALIGDRTLVPADRWMLIRGIAGGYCRGSREMISGLSDARRESMVRSAELAADIPGTDEWVDLNTRFMEYIGDPMHLMGAEGESLLQKFIWAVFRPLITPMMGPVACVA